MVLLRMEARRWWWRRSLQGIHSTQLAQLLPAGGASAAVTRGGGISSLVFRQKSNLVNGGSGNNSSHCLKVSNPPDVFLREKRNQTFSSIVINTSRSTQGDVAPPEVVKLLELELELHLYPGLHCHTLYTYFISYLKIK